LLHRKTDNYLEKRRTDSSSSFSPASTSVGVLSDGPIAGVSYTTSPSNLSGKTTIDGEYRYRPGDTVTFTLGGVALPAVPATGRVTPATIAAHIYSGDADKIANATVNLAVLMQTLDNNQDPDDGIFMGATTLTSASLLNDLDEAPTDFSVALGNVLPAGVDPVEVGAAVAHYYGQELPGTWKAVAVKETVVYGGREETGAFDFTNALGANLGFLFSFDSRGRFIYSTWDTTATTDEEREGDVAVGEVVFPESDGPVPFVMDESSSTTVRLRGIERQLAEESDYSSTDPTEPLLRGETTVVLQGDKLIVTNVWQDDYDEDESTDTITSVFTLERVQNQKSGLLGSWLEENEQEGYAAPDGSVNFGYHVDGRVTYFLSDTLLAHVNVANYDLDDPEQKNGIVIANYSRNGNTITLGAIKYDGVSVAGEEPVLTTGASLTTAVSSDGRTVVYTQGIETTSGRRILAKSETPAFISASTSGSLADGYWRITEVTGSNTCGEEVGEQFSKGYRMSLEGFSLTVYIAESLALTGTLNGQAATWAGSYSEDGGTVSQTTTATFSKSMNTVQGSSTWTWREGSESCSGTTTFTGARFDAA
jgi:hypothetical protein